MQRLGLDEAYARVPKQGVAIERPGRGLVRLTGDQRIWFLQNTITNDVDDVGEGRWVESCFLDLKGKVVAHFRAGVLADEVWLDVDPPGTRDLVDWFVRYRFRTRVEIEDRTEDAACVSVLGPPAVELAGPGEVRRMGDAVVFGDTVGSAAIADVRGGEVPDVPRAGEELYELLRIEAGVGRFGRDYGPDTLPQEAGLTRVVSVTKGCYIGQEVMARLHFRGHVNRCLRPLRFDGVGDRDVVGDELRSDDRVVGKVTSVARSPSAGTIGMGMARVEIDEGAEVDVTNGGRARFGPIPPGTKVTSDRTLRREDGR